MVAWGWTVGPPRSHDKFVGEPGWAAIRRQNWQIVSTVRDRQRRKNVVVRLGPKCLLGVRELCIRRGGLRSNLGTGNGPRPSLQARTQLVVWIANRLMCGRFRTVFRLGFGALSQILWLSISG